MARGRGRHSSRRGKARRGGRGARIEGPIPGFGGSGGNSGRRVNTRPKF